MNYPIEFSYYFALGFGLISILIGGPIQSLVGIVFLFYACYGLVWSK
jgi:hypothetical protein